MPPLILSGQMTKLSQLPESSIYQTKEVLASLYQISRLSSVSDGRDDLIRTVLETIINGLQYDRVALYLLKMGTSILEGVINVGCQVSVKGVKYDLYADDCVETRVVKTAEIITIKSGCDHSFYTPIDRKRNEVLKRTSCVLLPIITKQGVIGTLLADRSHRQGIINRDDIEILEIFCNQIGIVVENLRLLESNRQKINELTMLQKISRSMSELRDLDSLCRLIVKEANRLGKSQGCWLQLNTDGVNLTTVAVDGCHKSEVDELDDESQTEEVRNGNHTAYRLLSMPAERGGHQVGVLAVPLVGGSEVRGIVKLLYQGNTGLAGINVDVIDVFAAQVSKAIENITFYQHLQKERDFRESILRSTPNGIITIDADLLITSCNQQARRLFSIHGELLHSPVCDIIDSFSFRQGLIEVVNGQRSMAQLEVVRNKSQGGEQNLLISINSLHHDWSREREILIMIQDQTGRKKMDREVERMKRLASIGQLAAGIAHEIRNPLTGMNISLDIIKEDVGENQQTVSLVDGVSRELDRLETIVSSLLEFSRTGTLDMGTIQLESLLQQWFPLFREQCKRSQVMTTLEVEYDLPPVRGDGEKLRQVLINLSLNALEAISGPGTINMKVGVKSANQISSVNSGLSPASPGAVPDVYVEIAVIDSGAGMNEEIKERVFDPFYTTRNQGTGLGLSIVHNIIKEHDGWIDVESEPGKGSRFAVFIPVAETENHGRSQDDVKSNTYY
ncbi:MAG: ATP-binding protein [Pseudomonadota bacterium]|nr:ATP-binding protein [Pseudomonadota bacterium]